MAIEARVITETLGSNPGCKCEIFVPGQEEEVMHCYLKYCTSSSIRRSESFLIPGHQAIYEAVTFSLARKLGLHTPDFFVVSSSDVIKFSYEEDVKFRVNKGWPYYFVSAIKSDSDAVPEKVEEIIQREELERGLLGISDIKGRRQNYCYDAVGKVVYYLDLGCSFVYAHQNRLHFANSHPKVDLNNKSTSKKLKKALNFIERYALELEDKRISLIEVVDGVASLQIPVLKNFRDFFNTPYEDISVLLDNQKELEEICMRIAFGMEKFLHSRESKNYDRLVKV